MKKLTDWWNRPITNGDIVKGYVKSAVYTIIGTYMISAYATKKIREMDNDTTVVYTTDSEDKEV